MRTMVTSSGRITIPKHIRDSLDLQPGTLIEFAVNDEGEVTLRAADAASVRRRRNSADRLSGTRDKAEMKWRTDEPMNLLRGDT